MKKLKIILFLTVITLLGVLFIIIPTLMNTCEGYGSRGIICLKIKDLKKRFNIFKLDNGTYPTTQEGFNALIKNPNPKKYPRYSPRGYLKKIPKDPWSTPFLYIKINNEIEIISFASDRKLGGEDMGKDIKFSECR